MSCYYFIANIDITDPEEYKKYLDEAGNVFKKFNGEYLAVDNQPVVLEGHWNYTKLVLIRFETEEDFNAWYHSPEYQKILKYRLNSARCDTILIKGKN